MSQLKVKSNAYGTITSTHGSGDTGTDASPLVVNLTAGHGNRFPSVQTGSGDWFEVTFSNNPPNKVERFKCIERDTGTPDVMKLVRAWDGSTAQNWAPGDRISGRWSAAQASEHQQLGGINQFLQAGGTVDAITATIVTARRALTDGYSILVENTAGPNATTTPTFTLTFDAAAYGGVTIATATKTIVDRNGTAVLVGDTGAVGYFMRLTWSTGRDKWVLENPAGVFVTPTATQANQEAASSTTSFVSPGRQQFHPSAAKGWCKADSAGAAAASYNVSSVADVGIGQVGVNWTTGFSSTSYCAVGVVQIANNVTVQAVSSGIENVTSPPATGRTDMWCKRSDGAVVTFLDPNYWHIAVFGDQP